MPREVFGPGHQFLMRTEVLSFEEIERLVRLMAEQGVSKLRLTGGEPLLRRDVERLIAKLAVVPGIDDIAMTTNASLLAQKAAGLSSAGLSRVTVSLDAIDDVTFRAMNDAAVPVARVLAGVDAAVEAGLPVKINAVIKRGLNHEELVPLAARFRHTGHTIRFIEFMDVGSSNGWRMEDVVPAAEMVATIGAVWPLEPVERARPNEVASTWRYVDGAGQIGVISSVTQPFCGACSRLRLSAEGRLYTCLFAADGFDVRTLLRDGMDDDALRGRLANLWARRTDRYSEIRTADTAATRKVEMSHIGG